MARRIRIFAAFAAVWLAWPAAFAVAQETRATVTGVVTDRNRTPLPRVRVIVRASDGLTEDPAVTDPQGGYRVAGLDPGDYVVIVEDPLPFRKEIKLAAGQTLEVLICLGCPPPETAAAGGPPGPGGPAEPPRDFSGDFSPVTDRWRLQFPVWQRYESDPNGEYPFVRNRGIGPYQQSTLKGDLPIAGDDIFLKLTGVLEVPFEYRRVPTITGESTERPDSDTFFGKGQQYTVLTTGVGSFELFKGSTQFKPRDWAVRVTPTWNMNYINTRERNVVSVTPEEGATRRRNYLALQEVFGEVKLFDVGANYDFVSVRAGIQPFSSDFRGFLFRDTNFGVRAFGTFGRNQNQWNVAWFDQLEKETNSDLNKRKFRKQKVFIANYYRQDFLTQGYTISPSFHMSDDDGEEEFDANGFLVRPSPIGLIAEHRVKSYFIGVGGDGHLGALNLTHQFYQAWGEDELNGISGQPVKIRAQFLALEASVDRDWLRPRVGFVWASGDPDPDDDIARGFDSIIDDPNIAGGPFGFWNREALPLAQTKVSLVGRNSILPALRSNKAEGQANFVNPGIIIVTGGFDAQLTPKLRWSTTANYLQFQYTDVLKRVLFQSEISKTIGFDVGGGVQYRPRLNDNILITAGASLFLPGAGFKQVSTTQPLFAGFAALTLLY